MFGDSSTSGCAACGWRSCRAKTRNDLHQPGDGERPSYREVADELGLTLTQVTNHLAWARRELRRLVLEHLATLSGSDAEIREEAEAIFGKTR